MTFAGERADLARQLSNRLAPLLVTDQLQEVYRELEMPLAGQSPSHRARRFDLPRVPLAVRDRQRIQLEPLVLRDGGGCIRIEATT